MPSNNNIYEHLEHSLELINQGLFDKAIPLLIDSLQLAKKVENPTHECFCMGELGYSYFRIGRNKEGEILLKQAISMARGIHQFDYLARYLALLGNIYQLKEDFDSALLLFEEALHSTILSDNRSDEYLILGNLCSILKANGQFQKALKYVNQALQVIPNGASQEIKLELESKRVELEEQSAQVPVNELNLSEDFSESEAMDMALYMVNNSSAIDEITVTFRSGLNANGYIASFLLGEGFPDIEFCPYGKTPFYLDFSEIAAVIIHQKDDSGRIFGKVPKPGQLEATGIELSGDYHFHQGVRQMNQERNEEAIESFLEALRLNPKRYQIYWNLGMLYADLGATEAVDAFESFLRYSPLTDDNKTYRNYATQFLKENNREIPEPETSDLVEELPEVNFEVQFGGKKVIIRASNDAEVGTEKLLKIFKKFITAPTFVDAFLIFEENSKALLSNLLDTYLQYLIDAVDNEDQRISGQLNRQLFQRVKTIGAIPAFAEAMEVDEQEFNELIKGTKYIQPILMQLVQIVDEDERLHILEQNHQLVQDPATYTFLKFLIRMQGNNSEARLTLEAIMRLLHSIRKGKGQPSKTRIEPDFLSDYLSKVYTELENAIQGRHLTQLDAAIENLEDFLKLAELNVFPEMHSNALGLIGLGLIQRYQLTNQILDLERAIRILKQAFSESESGSWIQSRNGINLSKCLLQDYELTGNLRNLHESITLLENLIKTQPEGTSEWATIVGNLGGSYLMKSEHQADPDVLDKSIIFLEQAISFDQLGSQSWSIRMTNLGKALKNRYYALGRLADLNRAKEIYEKVLSEINVQSPMWLNAMNGLGSTFHFQARFSHSVINADQAIDVFEKALEIGGGESLDWFHLKNNLSNVYRTRYDIGREESDLDKAMEVGRQLLERGDPDYYEYPRWQENLAKTISLKIALNKDEKFLQEATRLYSAVVKNPNAASELVLTSTFNLGSTYLLFYRVSGNTELLRKAIPLMEQAFAKMQVATHKVDLLECSLILGEFYFSKQEWDLALPVLKKGMEVLDDLYHTQLTYEGRTSWLKKAQDLPQWYAYALGKTGQLEKSILCLENARARILNETLDLDQHYSRQLVASGYPDLAKRYREKSEYLQQLQIQQRRTNETANTDLIEKARSDLNGIVSNIRKRKGLENFLRPFNFEDIHALAKRAPLIYTTSTPFGSYAFIVRHVPDEPLSVIELPDLTEEALNSHLEQYLVAYLNWKNQTSNSVAKNQWLNCLEMVTSWLWEVLMGPLCQALTVDSEAVIIPFGRLFLLPLHAAWATESNCRNGRIYAQDLVLWRYAPNARSIHFGETIAGQSGSETILTITDPQPVNAETLTFAELEMHNAFRLFNKVISLKGKEAGKTQALASFPHAHIIHFACHGFSRPENPLKSGLLLANDEILYLKDLLAEKLWKARLVVMSACETGVIGKDLPDEVIGFPTGMLQCGAAGVIASSWSVEDVSTGLLMSRFYEFWKREHDSPARSLRKAQSWLRESNNKELSDFLEELLEKYSTADAAFGKLEVWLEKLILSDPEARPFSSPFYWAAFYYTGV